MRNVWFIAKRELGAIFVQPIAYIFAIAVIGITGLFFSAQVGQMALAPGSAPVSASQALQIYSALFVFVAPAMTMRLLSEEQRSGTMELLMTLPVRDGEVVWGKFVAAFIFYVATTAVTLVYPLILINFGNPDVGVMFTSYLGVLLSGGALIAIGILASSFTDSQLVAFFIAFAIILGLYLALIPATYFELGPLFSSVFEELSFDQHLFNFFGGLILAKDVAYYVGITAVSLFAATRILESRRWR
ncbi:MAG: ABC transporter permease subunit [Chloroflexi bacterium]|nr:ABC transporter permease subunit [Chloroflexota bacterium]